MPFVRVNDADIHYAESGSGAETIVFAHGLLFNGKIFESQIEALEKDYRCIAFDFRGQGKSEITRSGYDLETLTTDTAALIEALGAAPCHYVGHSMGGFIGLRLALRRPELLKSLTLLDSSADRDAILHRIRNLMLNAVARTFGLAPVVDRVMRLAFSPQALRNDELRSRWRHEIIANDRLAITLAVKGVVGRSSVLDELSRISVPALIVVGDRDILTPPVHSERMHAAIPGSRLEVLPGVGHTSTIEAPEAVTRLISEFVATAA